MKRHEVHYDDDCSREDARGTSTGYGATNNEGSGVGRSPTYCRSDFKEADGVKEDPLGVVKSVDTAHEELEAGPSEHIGAGVPSNVVKGVEIIGDCGYGGCDDGAVLFCN